ncbi:class I poly(R)-hydroxyalkanoic acid synthase [Pusillimonas sp. TS35]|uniref:PHA/PHB synthase family protein n=1 Tax=Paracandidimonas lactea TaxID=2895524 RepID=UPI0013697058|nr:class I poly(R)-hydroxyalkanoic acid synthase [Paracandidimonas lactea]MYN13770.1 class I poly(R)-hydroxyalkanoic acid synthase [Pusillimonas sp. TS35]
MNNPLFSTSWIAQATIPPQKLAQIQQGFTDALMRVAVQAQQGALAAPQDRRFQAPAWSANPAHAYVAHAYLIASETIEQMVEAAEVDEALRERLRFSAMQWVQAMSPANFLATNPEAQQALIDSGGQSLCRGIGNLLHDMRQGRLTQSDESQFEVGVSLATTPGDVVLETPLFQLIQYAPLTTRTYRRPLVLVPPCINKYYILDLQPHNSFVRYAVEQGHTVFLVSWRNPGTEDTDGVDRSSWGDYLDAVLMALDAAGTICAEEQVNALGFCVGGTILASALALAKARGEDPVASLTLLTTLLDFTDAGVLHVFVDEQHAALRDQQLGAGGLMSARELATTFSFLRPGELVWNYVRDNYLMGGTPPAFDLLYWNADGTNLPGPFFTWYFRNTYLENNLKVPGRVKVGEQALDLGSLDMPAYVYGSREDHIVPWQSAYASSHLLGGPVRFVLGASGHIAGVINPPAKGRRNFWASDAAPEGEPAAWLDGATNTPGSWWPNWAAWLAEQGGGERRAPTRRGNARYKPVEPAPGRYVRTRAL